MKQKSNRNKLTCTHTFTIDDFENRRWILSFGITCMICLCYFDESCESVFSWLWSVFFSLCMIIVPYLIQSMPRKWWKNKIRKDKTKKWIDLAEYVFVLVFLSLNFAGNTILLIWYLMAYSIVASSYFSFLLKYFSLSLLTDVMFGFLLFGVCFFTISFVLNRIIRKYRNVFIV